MDLPRRRRLWRRAAAVIVVLPALYLGATFGQVWFAARTDGARPADAIVVLGAAQYDGRPSPVLRARLDHAAELWEEGIAPVVVVTGGRREGDRFTEATAAADYLLRRGLPDEQVLRETGGTSSYESLAAAARFLRARELVEVVLVSDPYHAARIAAIAAEVGLDASVSPARGVSRSPTLRQAGRETLAVAIGRLVGFRRLGNVGLQLPLP